LIFDICIRDGTGEFVHMFTAPFVPAVGDVIHVEQRGEWRIIARCWWSVIGGTAELRAEPNEIGVGAATLVGRLVASMPALDRNLVTALEIAAEHCEATGLPNGAHVIREAIRRVKAAADAL